MLELEIGLADVGELNFVKYFLQSNVMEKICMISLTSSIE